MAIKANMNLPFGEKAERYFMIGGVARNYMVNSVSMSLIVFKDDKAREKQKLYQGTVISLNVELQNKTLALVAAKDEDKSALEREMRSLSIELEGAVDRLKELGEEYAPQEDKEPVNIGPDKIGAVLNDDGDFSKAKAYAYLKTLPRFKDAVDLN